MSLDLSSLADVPRLLLHANLRTSQGSRFQPTGFPDLGAATFEGFNDTGQPVECLLVESAQSMANRMEAICWDEGADDLVEPLKGLPYVRSTLPDGQVTDSIREAHRLNSPYIVNSKEFKETIQPEIGFEANQPFDRRRLAKALLNYDPCSLLHGTFLEKVGGVVRLPRAISSFIEAEDVKRVDSGGVKFDRVQPASGENTPYGKAAEGYGNVPYHRTEFAASTIRAYFNIDLMQLRGYGLGENAENLLIALSLYKIQSVLHCGLRLRTACDFDVVDIEVKRPDAYTLASLEDLTKSLPSMISACSDDGLFADPSVTDVIYKK